MDEHRLSSPAGRQPLVFAALLSSLLALTPATSPAYWSSSPTTPLTLALGSFQHCAPDSAGGAFVLYAAEPSGALRIQRLDRVGRKHWPDDGTLAGSGASSTCGARVAPDGTGGAYIVWTSYDGAAAGNTIRAQHVAADGTCLWGTEGRAVSDAGDHGLPGLLPDGLGGLFVSWLHDPHTGNTRELLAQHLDGDGLPSWAPGPRVFMVADLQSSLIEPIAAMIPDGEGGLFVGCEPSRVLSVLRVDAAGNVLWNTGTGLFSTRRQLRPDGAGGVLALGDDGWLADVQRVSGAGALLWPAGPHLPLPANGLGGILETDDSGNAFQAYPDTLARTMRARHLNANGVVDLDQPLAQIGAVMWSGATRVARTVRGSAWLAMPAPTPPEPGPTRLLLTQARWTGTLAALACSTTVMQMVESNEVGYDMYDFAPGPGNSFVVGASAQFGAPSTVGRVFVARSDSDGFLGTTEPVIERTQDVPGDAGGFVRLHWRPSDLAAYSHVTGLVYDVLQAPSANGPWTMIAAGLTSAGTGDSLTVPTLADSSAGCDCRTYYIVRARADGGIVRDSPPAAAASFDNAGPPLAVGDGARPALRVWPVTPSPAHAAFDVRFALARELPLELSLFDSAGRRVRRLARGTFAAGEHTLHVDVTSHTPRLAPGSYFVRLGSPGGQRVVRAIVLH